MKIKKLIILLCFIFLVGCDKPPKYELYKSGEVESIEYLNGSWTTADKTIIRFSDKTTLILSGIYQAPFRKINVYRAIGEYSQGVYPGYKIFDAERSE